MYVCMYACMYVCMHVCMYAIKHSHLPSDMSGNGKMTLAYDSLAGFDAVFSYVYLFCDQSVLYLYADLRMYLSLNNNFVIVILLVSVL